MKRATYKTGRFGELIVATSGYLSGFNVNYYGVFINGTVYAEKGVNIHPGCAIGGPPEWIGNTINWGVIIAENTIIRENTVIQGGAEQPTFIGANCYIMHGCHIPHDADLYDNVRLSPGVMLGGFTQIHMGANLGIGAKTHQYVTIGAGAMVGMGAVVTRHVPPKQKVAGIPAQWMGENNPPAEVLPIEHETNQIALFDLKKHPSRKTIEIPDKCNKP